MFNIHLYTYYIFLILFRRSFIMLKQFMKSRKGFTLVELMVVVVILGILTSIAIPVYNQTQENAREKACFANQRIMEGAAQQHVANEGSLPTTTVNGDAIYDDYLSEYLKDMPVCPGTSSEEGVYSLEPDGTVRCSVHDYYGGE